MKKYIKRLILSFGYELNKSKSSTTKNSGDASNEVPRLFDLVLAYCGKGHSSTPHKQDIFALIVNDFKDDGFFVEFGAAGGKAGSTTYLLEREYNWTGILSEPSCQWHEDLKRNRDCIIDFDCVWRDSGDYLKFHSYTNGFRSTIEEFSSVVDKSAAGNLKESYYVKTISLTDLLKKYNAPRNIDFMTIDTEGSEVEILNSFNFKNYRFNAICVEHNYSHTREQIQNIMQENGYRRVFDHLSRHDDWYIPKDSIFFRCS